MKKGKLNIRKYRKPRIKIRKSCEELRKQYSDSKEVDMNDPNYLSLLRCMSDENREILGKHEDEYTYLYPILEDPNFNYKIAAKKEFFDNRYEEKSRSDFDNIKEVAQALCDNTEFELEPHQMFVRNFMSFQTPYNGLLLFHGVGTGKTCSAISVCEEMRTYMKQLGITKRIIIVASPAVQENFRLQLFDERKLKEVNGLWNIKACIGNKFLKEINPMNMKGLSRNRVVRQIKRIISQSYQFQGYIEFSNNIARVMQRTVTSTDPPDLIKRKRRRALRKEFSNRMLVIDEVHNLRITNEGMVKPSSENVLALAANAMNLKILILSATPMFNSYSEIIWLLNLLNLNDKRFPIRTREVFDKMGNFVQNSDGKEVGKDLLIQKMSGYVSYVRGNNPFTFPYSVYPQQAGNPQSLLSQMYDGVWKYPSKQLNGADIIAPISALDLTMTNVGDYQQKGYSFIINALRKKYHDLDNPTKGIVFTVLEGPLQALNIVYPHTELETTEDADVYSYLYGQRGLARVMNYDQKTKSEFRYKDKTLQDFGRIFAPEQIGKYSGKIAYICESIRKSKGIVFIYSQYIGGGAIPIALALEEMGFTRYGTRTSLFSTPPTPPIDAITLKPPKKGDKFHRATYTMITGDKSLTIDVRAELAAATGDKNINGERVKVIIVSRAGSEGLDFQNIRQTHILDPWYNLNRQDQIIGRAVRNFSHCALPYEERNVQIFLYGTTLKSDVEAADLYVYRLAENKARKIAVIIRVLKENAVDCLLNRKGQNFSEEKIDKSVKQTLSNGKVIEYKLGDKNNSQICDFTSCEYKCNTKVQTIEEIDTTTYNESFIIMNLDKILQRIRLLFREDYIFERSALIVMLTHTKQYPLDQIYTALNYLVTENNEYITDMLGRLGHLVNIGNYYMFQPVELGTETLTRFERTHPIDFKRKRLIFNLPENIPRYQINREGIKEVSISDTGSNVLRNLRVGYIELQTRSFIESEDKENWAKSAAWAIHNLEQYNKIDSATLLQLAVDHLIDVLPYKDKYSLLATITQSKEGKRDPLELMASAYFNKFMIKAGTYTGIVLADFSKPSAHNAYTILTLVDNRWVSSKESIRGGLGRALFDKFQIKDISKINSTIGFMTVFKRQTIVFKTKYIGMSSKGRTNKGRRCDRGEAKGRIIARINKLLGGVTIPIKYVMKKSTIDSIYGKKEVEQKIPARHEILEKKKKKDKLREVDKWEVVKINSLQLCIESELILRYYDKIAHEGKRWFFNSVDAIINNIVTLGSKLKSK